MINQVKKGMNYVGTSLNNSSSFGVKIAFFQIASKTIPRLLPVSLRFLMNPIVRKNQKLIMSYLYKHYGYVKDVFLQSQNRYLIDKEKSNKNIWVMWLQGEENAPQLVQACIKSIKENNKDAAVHIITQDNVRKYIEVPERLQWLFNEKKVSATHYSDYCRVALLAKYGGIWVDSTIFMTNKIPDEVFKRNFYTVRASKARKEIMSIARYRWNTFFMGGIGGSDSIFEFSRLLLFEYWKSENVSLDYLLIDYAMNMACETIPQIGNDISDTPLNNRKILWLEKNINKAFNIDKWQAMKHSDTYMYKLTYKNIHKKTNQGVETYYAKLLKSKL